MTVPKGRADRKGVTQRRERCLRPSCNGSAQNEGEERGLYLRGTRESCQDLVTMDHGARAGEKRARLSALEPRGAVVLLMKIQAEESGEGAPSSMDEHGERWHHWPCGTSAGTYWKDTGIIATSFHKTARAPLGVFWADKVLKAFGWSGMTQDM